MVNKFKFQTLEDEILALQNEIKSSESVPLAKILKLLSGKGRPLLLLLLSLPFCQPIQIPGLSMPFGFLIAFIGARLVYGRANIWLPRFMLSKEVSTKTLQKISDGALTLIRKIKPWAHSRLNWMCHSMIMKKINGITIVVLGVLLALPVPIPLSNMTAAWSILLIAIGMLEDDGVFVLMGYIVSILTALFFLLILINLKNVVGLVKI